jgi:addiction module HigA family antidote
MLTASTTIDPTRRKRTRPPTHPGGIIKRMHMEPLRLTVTQLAAVLGVSRKTLSKIVNERAGLTPDMALRLSRAFGTTPDLWLNLQKAHDLWIAEHESTGWENVTPIPVPAVGDDSQATA